MAGGTRTVAGRYRLIRRLGRGGMGAVWQAHDELLGRDVAIKEIYFPGAGDEPVDADDPLVRRALREAQAAARLRHPDIITVHDVVTDAGRPWIVMELIDGQSLAELIRAAGLVPVKRAAVIGLRVLDALRAAHRQGVLHRDVKPANILLDTDRVVLTDFGIAALDDATALTVTGQMVGSPAFMAPERINGKPATAAADMWALGVTLYTAVTGRSPFQRDDTQATVAAILSSRPEPPAHAGQLWAVIKGLLEKDPERRLTSEQARPLLAAVASAADPRPIPSPRRGLSRFLSAAGRRSRFDTDERDPTAVAPSPTLAAPTALHPPDGPTVVPDPAAPAADTIPAVPAVPAAAPDEATETVAAPEDAAKEEAAEENEAAETASENAPETVAAPTVADGAAATVADGAAETVAEDAAETVRVLPPASDPWADAGGPATPPQQDAAPRPPDPATPEYAAPLVAQRRPVPMTPADLEGTAATRRRVPGKVLVAVGVAVAVVVAAPILWFAWPRSDKGDERIAAPVPSGSAALAVAPSKAKPSPTNPLLDPCLVGSWRMTSMQVINEPINGVDARFTSTGGATTRIWPDGRAVDSYAGLKPLTARVRGRNWEETIRGTIKYRIETRAGKAYFAEHSGQLTFTMKREGRKQFGGNLGNGDNQSPYTCSDTKMTTYGDDDSSTQSFVRVSRTP